LRKQILLIVLLVAFAGCGKARQPGTDARSYEMYSWQFEGKWVYMIFDTSNRPKVYKEIVTNRAARIGVEAFEYQLKNLPKGSEVFWRKAAPEGMEVPKEGKSVVLTIPPKDEVEKLKAACDRLGLKLNMG